MTNGRQKRPGTGRTFTSTICALAVTLLLAGCSRNGGTRADADPKAAAAETRYVASLQPLNQKVTGSEASGEVSFAISGDWLTITTDARGLPPGTTHWQHFHGFPDGRKAACPTEAGAGELRCPRAPARATGRPAPAPVAPLAALRTRARRRLPMPA